MAYITQYEADMQGDQRNRQNQQAIGNGLIGMIAGFNENRRRAIDAKKAEDAQDLAFAKDGVDQEAVDLYKKGDKSGLTKFYAGLNEAKRDQAARDKFLSERVAESTIKANEAKLTEAGKSFEDSKEGQAFNAKAAHEMALKDKELQAKANATTGEAFEVPGFGMVRTKAEATNIRKAKADADEAKAIIAQIKDLGTNIGPLDRERQGKIQQLKTVLAGKMRLPLLGPGTMTESEYERLVNNMGDPSAYFGTEKNEKSKLDQLSGILDNSVASYYKAAASNNQPGMYQVQQQPQGQQPPQQVIQKIQQYTPEQKAQRLQQLRAKKAGVAMVGQ